MKPVRIVEGIAGYWYYHLREEGELTSLCGATVMHTSIPLSSWGISHPHINERWCSKCRKIADDQEMPIL